MESWSTLAWPDGLNSQYVSFLTAPILFRAWCAPSACPEHPELLVVSQRLNPPAPSISMPHCLTVACSWHHGAGSALTAGYFQTRSTSSGKDGPSFEHIHSIL